VTQRSGIDYRQILAIDEHPATVRDIQPLQQSGQGAFSRTGTTDNTNYFSRLHFELHLTDDVRSIGPVTKRDLVELNGTFQPGDPGFLADHFGLGVENIAQ